MPKAKSRFTPLFPLAFFIALVLLLSSCSGTQKMPLSGAADSSGNPPFGARGVLPANSAGENPTGPYDLVFAVGGDSRNEKPDWIAPGNGVSYRGYISKSLDAARNNILARPEWVKSTGFFFMHLGDFGMRGGKPVFDLFKSIMEPFHTAGVPTYLAIGNHELRYYMPSDWREGESDSNANTAQTDYKTAFTGPMYLPEGAQYLSGYEGLAYHFRRGNNVFVILDAYFANPNAKDKYKKGYYSIEQLKWLQNTLDDYRKENPDYNIFVLSHEPAFDPGASNGSWYHKYDDIHKDDKEHCDKKKLCRANWILWALLERYDVDTFFCGHSHFYHRWYIKGGGFRYNFRKGWEKPNAADFAKSGIMNRSGPWTKGIPQIVNGKMGPKAEEFDGNEVPAVHRFSTDNFSIVSVRGRDILIEVYAYGKNGSDPALIDKFEKSGGKWQDLVPSHPPNDKNSKADY